MKKTYATVFPDTSMKSAIEIMHRDGLGVVMVTDATGSLLGALSNSEVTSAVVTASFENLPVSTFMCKNPETVDVTDSLDVAYQIAHLGEFDYIPVLEDDIVVGIVSMNGLVPFWSEFMELQAKRLSRNYERALSIMAHDLRSPISTIKTTNLLLTSGELEADEYMESGFPEVLDSSCDLMLKLIDDILDVEKLRVGAVRLEKTLTDLEDVIDLVVRCHRPTAAVKGMSLDIDIPTAVPKVKIDPRRIEQVLNNLIGNAIKFSPDGSQVVVGLKGHHSTVAIWVADNGPGIPERELDKLFLEFSATTVRPTRGEKGHGLGLAISKRLVEAHNGSIRVDSEEGVGTTFTIFLPIGTIQ